MIIRYSLAISLLVLSSCTMTDIWTPPDQSDTSTLVQTGTTVKDIGDIQTPLTENLSGSGDAYYPVFQGLETRVFPIQHSAGIKTKVSFINSEAKRIHVVVSFPGSATGNLRLSQIIMPDGNMDGPFGTDTSIELTQFGGYELLFHENLMAGDPWSGTATISMSLLEK